MKYLWQSALAGIVVLLANYFWVSDAWGRVGAWAVTMGAMAFFMATVGIALQGRPAGILIDNRTRVSLSKLQATAWTILVLSGLTVLVATKLEGITVAIVGPKGIEHKPFVGDPIAIGTTLLAAMGISATSLTLTPAILSLKNTADTASVFSRDPRQRAEWLDMFRGDDTSNSGSPDLSKIQQFLVSLIVIVGYGFMLAKALRLGVPPSGGGSGPALLGFPDMDDGMVWLLGISHAGYLTYKAVPHGGGNDDSGSGSDANTASDPRQTPVG